MSPLRKARLILDQSLSTELDYLLDIEPKPHVAETNSLPDIPPISANTCLEQKRKKFHF